MATTPPLRTSAHTPLTPLHGAKYDQYRQSTRKSTRHTRSRALETPPPNAEEPSHNPAPLNPRKASNLRSVPHTYSPPSSTHTSPRKRSGKQRMSNHKTDANAMNGRGSSTEPSSLDPVHDQDRNPSSRKPPLKATTSMLPTPAKTPRKKLVQSSAVNGAARVLFPVHSVEDAMPTPRKRKNKRHVEFSLYSSMEDEGGENSEGKIQIYTDSKDKVPELDPSEDNPFYEQPEQHTLPPEPSKGRSRKKCKIAHIAEDRKEIKEAFNREEGMVYVFRGKKIFRKFPKDGDEPDDGGESELESTNVRPLTRSSIKPRLLFPTPKQRQERETTNIDDEEATTDIEDHHDSVMSDHEEEHITTPRKQTVFSPATPPTTGHATRQATKRAPEELVEAVPYKGKKVSPFDGWARTKAGSGTAAVRGGKGKKREAEAMEKTEVPRGSKKIKGAGVT